MRTNKFETRLYLNCNFKNYERKITQSLWASVVYRSKIDLRYNKFNFVK